MMSKVMASSVSSVQLKSMCAGGIENNFMDMDTDMKTSMDMAMEIHGVCSVLYIEMLIFMGHIFLNNGCSVFKIELKCYQGVGCVIWKMILEYHLPMKQSNYSNLC